jgi:hypothetical protein
LLVLTFVQLYLGVLLAGRVYNTWLFDLFILLKAPLALMTKNVVGTRNSVAHVAKISPPMTACPRVDSIRRLSAACAARNSGRGRRDTLTQREINATRYEDPDQPA